jgi:hypothetical protein
MEADFPGSGGGESWSKFPPFVACEKYHKHLPTASRVNIRDFCAFATETQKHRVISFGKAVNLVVPGTS